MAGWSMQEGTNGSRLKPIGYCSSQSGGVFVLSYKPLVVFSHPAGICWPSPCDWGWARERGERATSACLAQFELFGPACV